MNTMQFIMTLKINKESGYNYHLIAIFMGKFDAISTLYRNCEEESGYLKPPTKG